MLIERFIDLSKIPRKSGNEKAIAEYIEKFAIKNTLKYIKDKYNNIIVFKEATNNSKDTVILQCHLDMVCEKTKESKHDFSKDPIEVYIDSGFLKAKDTTLGADNGIGIATILEVLESKEIKHPNLECVFTVEEETTMNGAKTIDLSMLKGNKIISTDSMEEKSILIGSASADIFDTNMAISKEENKENLTTFEISLSNFLGGHSGFDINKGRLNAIKYSAEIIKNIKDKFNAKLCFLEGGDKVNVIPLHAKFGICIEKDKIISLKEYLEEYINNANEDINLNIEEITTYKEYISDSSLESVLNYILEIKNGCLLSDNLNNSLLSLNIGIADIDVDKCNLQFSIRSNRETSKNVLIRELNTLFDKYYVSYNTSSLKGYEAKQDGKLLKLAKEKYLEVYNKNPKLTEMHICLESGFFSEKIKDLEFIAISPNIYDAHSTNERCDIASLDRSYKVLLKILESL